MHHRIMHQESHIPNPLSLLLAPPAAAIDEYLRGHQTWVESVAGCPLADTIVFDFHLPFDHLVLTDIFSGLPVDARCVCYESALRPVIEKWEVPPQAPPRIELSLSRSRETGVAAGKFGWELSWRDTPIALWPKDCLHAIVFAMVPYQTHDHGSGPGSRSTLIVNRQEMPAVLRMMEAIVPPRRISVMAGRDIQIPPGGYNWDSMVLSAELDRFVRRDFDSFFQREDWFRQHNLPYRRGYMFYGPPGNGKTSAARIMASHPSVRAFGVNFRTRGENPYSPEQLSDLFEAAASQSPSVVILEDLDKAGAGDADELRQAVNGLLSCMDGLSTEDGVIVVATANNPEPLGAALVKRPGRFDRVAHFAPPAPNLRQRYLARLSVGRIDGTAAIEASAAMERFSYAQVRETYILAGQFAFDRGDDLIPADMVQAANHIRREGRRARVNGDGGGVGFSVAEDRSEVAIMAWGAQRASAKGDTKCFQDCETSREASS